MNIHDNSNRFMQLGRSVSSACIWLFHSLKKTGQEHLTVMFVPHSEKKIFNFEISYFAIIFFLGISGILGMGGLYLFIDRTNIEHEVQELSNHYIQSMEILHRVQKNISALRDISKKINGTTKNLVQLANSKTKKNQSLINADKASFETQTTGKNNPLWDHELNHLNHKFRLIHKELSGFYKLLDGYKTTMNYLPSIFPVAPTSIGRGYINSRFGFRRDPITSRIREHQGIDIINLPGAPVVATANGIVTKSGHSPSKGFYVEIDHKFGYSTRYYHLSANYPYVGQKVSKGTKIGRLGASGRATGAHLHYEIRINNRPVDPTAFVKLDKFDPLD